MHYCYILSNSQNNNFYISHTDNLKEEIFFHNEGKINSTSNSRPWSLIWYSAFSSKYDAKEFEKFLKTEIGQKFMKKWFIPKEKSFNERPEGATTCPICGGAGKAPNQLFFKYGKRQSGNEVICSNCIGKGWVISKKAESYE